MIKGIDHLVIVVKDLDQAAQDYQQLGFTVVPGGQHPVGSHNVLISFADGSYLELIAFYREAIDHRWWQPLQKGERLVDFCIQTDDLARRYPEVARRRRGDQRSGALVTQTARWVRTKMVLSLGHRQPSRRGAVSDRRRDPAQRADSPAVRSIQQRHRDRHSDVAVGELAKSNMVSAPCLASKACLLPTILSADGLRFPSGHTIWNLSCPRDAVSPLINWLREFGPSPYAAVLGQG